LKWVAREKAKVDRIACPWVIEKLSIPPPIRICAAQTGLRSLTGSFSMYRTLSSGITANIVPSMHH
jgi:hypothetical protein